MLKKLKETLADKKNINEEHVEIAYNYLDEYCNENKLDLIKFVKDKNNIRFASEYINKNLGFIARKIFTVNFLEEILIKNHDFIVEKAIEKHKK